MISPLTNFLTWLLDLLFVPIVQDSNLISLWQPYELQLQLNLFYIKVYRCTIICPMSWSKYVNQISLNAIQNHTYYFRIHSFMLRVVSCDLWFVLFILYIITTVFGSAFHSIVGFKSCWFLGSIQVFQYLNEHGLSMFQCHLFFFIII